MAEYTQQDRLVKLDTVLGGDTLMVPRFTGVEAVSRPFRFDVDLVSTQSGIDPNELLRTPAVIRVMLSDDSERIIHGRFNRFALVGRRDDLVQYHAQLVPWTWFLSLRRNSRIFQNKSVIDIASEIFNEKGYQDFEVRCESPPAREYVVQYNESDLDFVSRWLEAEGIFYYFEHTEEKHTLVLADDNAAVEPCPLQSAAQLSARRLLGEDTVLSVSRERSIQPGKVALKDFDYLQPSLTLEAMLEGDGFEEVFEYPGKFTMPEEGDRYARFRLEAEEARREEIRGTGNCRWMVSGHSFELDGHFDPGLNGEYLLTAITHTCQSGGFRTGDAGNLEYYSEFTAIPASVPYRPARVTPRPTVKGLQTAMVVGPAGEELYVDSYGRVKVQFHWDREGQYDENSSCWMRFASPWGGPNYGSVNLPRIGTEVLVDFLEGDPDRPIITACVFNAEQMPPFTLPGAGIQMGMKSRSSPGGGGYNEFSMTDTKDEEQITIHAQYDMATTVEHDQTDTVKNDRTLTVTGNDTETVKEGNRTIQVETGTHTETIKGDTSIIIESGTYSLDVQTQTHTHHVKGDVIENYDATQTTTVKKKISITSAEAEIHLTASKEIKLVSGDSSLLLKSDGTIQLIGKQVQIQGEDEVKVGGKKIEVSAGDEAKLGVGSQNVTCDKTKVGVSGAAINSSAVGMHEITGAVVKIN